MTREAMQQALDALEVATTPFAKDRQTVLRAITALRSALAQPECPPDCRTCQRFISLGDGCTTVFACIGGNQYAPTSPLHFWSNT